MSRLHWLHSEDDEYEPPEGLVALAAVLRQCVRHVEAGDHPSAATVAGYMHDAMAAQTSGSRSNHFNKSDYVPDWVQINRLYALYKDLYGFKVDKGDDAAYKSRVKEAQLWMQIILADVGHSIEEYLVSKDTELCHLLGQADHAWTVVMQYADTKKMQSAAEGPVWQTVRSIFARMFNRLCTKAIPGEARLQLPKNSAYNNLPDLDREPTRGGVHTAFVVMRLTECGFIRDINGHPDSQVLYCQKQWKDDKAKKFHMVLVLDGKDKAVCDKIHNAQKSAALNGEVLPLDNMMIMHVLVDPSVHGKGKKEAAIKGAVSATLTYIATHKDYKVANVNSNTEANAISLPDKKTEVFVWKTSSRRRRETKYGCQFLSDSHNNSGDTMLLFGEADKAPVQHTSEEELKPLHTEYYGMPRLIWNWGILPVSENVIRHYTLEHMSKLRKINSHNMSDWAKTSAWSHGWHTKPYIKEIFQRPAEATEEFLAACGRLFQEADKKAQEVDGTQAMQDAKVEVDKAALEVEKAKEDLVPPLLEDGLAVTGLAVWVKNELKGIAKDVDSDLKVDKATKYGRVISMITEEASKDGMTVVLQGSFAIAVLSAMSGNEGNTLNVAELFTPAYINTFNDVDFCLVVEDGSDATTTYHPDKDKWHTADTYTDNIDIPTARRELIDTIYRHMDAIMQEDKTDDKSIKAAQDKFSPLVKKLAEADDESLPSVLAELLIGIDEIANQLKEREELLLHEGGDANAVATVWAHLDALRQEIDENENGIVPWFYSDGEEEEPIEEAVEEAPDGDVNPEHVNPEQDNTPKSRSDMLEQAIGIFEISNHPGIEAIETVATKLFDRMAQYQQSGNKVSLDRLYDACLMYTPELNPDGFGEVVATSKGISGQDSEDDWLSYDTFFVWLIAFFCTGSLDAFLVGTNEFEESIIKSMQEAAEKVEEELAARRAAEQEAARKAAEQEARKKQEAARQAAEQEAERKAARLKEQQDAAARKKLQDEMAAAAKIQAAKYEAEKKAKFEAMMAVDEVVVEEFNRRCKNVHQIPTDAKGDCGYIAVAYGLSNPVIGDAVQYDCCRTVNNKLIYKQGDPDIRKDTADFLMSAEFQRILKREHEGDYRTQLEKPKLWIQNIMRCLLEAKKMNDYVRGIMQDLKLLLPELKEKLPEGSRHKIKLENAIKKRFPDYAEAWLSGNRMKDAAFPSFFSMNLPIWLEEAKEKLTEKEKDVLRNAAKMLDEENWMPHQGVEEALQTLQETVIPAVEQVLQQTINEMTSSQQTEETEQRKEDAEKLAAQLGEKYPNSELPALLLGLVGFVEESNPSDTYLRKASQLLHNAGVNETVLKRLNKTEEIEDRRILHQCGFTVERTQKMSNDVVAQNTKEILEKLPAADMIGKMIEIDKWTKEVVRHRITLKELKESAVRIDLLKDTATTSLWNVEKLAFAEALSKTDVWGLLTNLVETPVLSVFAECVRRNIRVDNIGSRGSNDWMAEIQLAALAVKFQMSILVINASDARTRVATCKEYGLPLRRVIVVDFDGYNHYSAVGYNQDGAGQLLPAEFSFSRMGDQITGDEEQNLL